jgi:hydroxymethylpyrimidine/phosphomethylpyrimidine kinase
MIGISIAGFDPSGGAGILTDVKTFNALGIHGTCVVTALTAQNPKKFYSIFPVPIEYIEQQFESIVNEYSIKYGKTGMLYSDKVIKTIYKKLKSNNINYIVDPVMIASSGGNLTRNNISKTLKNNLVKDSLLFTPNLSEAEILSEMNIKNLDDSIEASHILSKYSDVLITGGHLGGNSVLNTDGKITIFKENLIDSENIHGSGCTLSAAITSYLVKGYDLINSIEKANKFVRIAIENGRYGTLGF